MHIGSSISHYKIVEKLGEGGMGVVYRAEDTKLERTVALKFLAQHLLNDDEAKERFLREAKAAAALSHPNICTVFEIAEADDTTFIAMEFVKGETLEDRIAQGPLSLKDALDIGRQVADGLEAAHEANIIHRDIKPANVMVDAKGRATIMDFGLARLTEASRLTKADAAMGTVAYMSPEHAQGIEVDSRTDIWALGCVLYEMVSGQRPFLGQYDQALLYEIVHEEIEPLTSIRAGVPMELEFIVGKCLAKERDDRHGTAGEVARDLRTLAEKLKSGRSTILRTDQMTGAVPAKVTAAQTLNPTEALAPDAVVMKRSSKLALQALAALLAIALFGVLVIDFSEATPDTPVRRFSFSHDELTRAVISPDGRNVVFSAQDNSIDSLWLRSLANEIVRRLPGTEGTYLEGFSWSPDSRSIVFGAGNQLKRVSIDGSAPVRLCEFPDAAGALAIFGGATWSPGNDRIVFSTLRSLWEVPALGGEPRELLTRDPGEYLASPHFLPERGIAFASGSFDAPRVEIMDLGTGERRDLAAGDSPVYSSSGHLLHHTSEYGLAATPFSSETLSITGDAFPIAEDGGWASVAHDGTLLYTDSGASLRRQIAVRDRAGRLLQTVGDPAANADALSVGPNGRHIAASIGGDIWIYDLDRDLGTRLTSSSVTENRPTWFSDTLVSYGLGDNALATQVADGSAAARVELDANPGMFFFDWSADGRHLVYTASDPAGGEGGLWYRERAVDGTLSEAQSYLRTPDQENRPTISPDGSYLAYRSNESGRYEIYVRSFPAGPGKWRVSSDGGSEPSWSADGTELFYRNGSALMTVAVSTENGFTIGASQILFESDDLLSPLINEELYSVFPDGQRFATFAPVVADGSGSGQRRARIVENWYEEFRDREQ